MARDNNSDADLLNVSKHIFGKNINKDFRKIINGFRNDFYYPLTLPWADSIGEQGVQASGGWRLCPNTNLEALQDRIIEAKADWDKEVNYFFKQLDSYRALAESKLGDAFLGSEFPNEDYEIDKLRSKFIFDVQFNNVPNRTSTNDIRINVSETLRKRIENDVQNRVSDNVKNILILTVDSLVGQVDHLAEKLKVYDPENKQKGFFNNSSIEKLRQAVEMLPSVNSDILGNDQAISDAHQQLVRVLASINSVESLRDDTELGESKRKQVAEGLEQSVGGLKGGFLERAFGGKKND